MRAEAIRGFVAAPFTPMEKDGSVDPQRIAPYADHLKRSGVSGAFVNGTTGEGYSLTIKERMSCAERWVSAQDDRLSVIVHVTTESVRDAKQLARHAQEIGASAIGAMSPVFFKPGLDEMIAWIRDVADAAPDLPLYYYHFPTMTGASFSVPDFLQRAVTEVPTLRGVKYTHDNLMEYRVLTEVAEGHFDLLFGRDEILLGALAMGAKGMVGSTYNYAMSLFTPLLASFKAGDLSTAEELHSRVVRLVQILVAHGGGIVCGKSMMKGVGLDLGPCRAPNATLGPDEIRQSLDAAQALGAFG